MVRSAKLFVFVTEQHYVSIFFILMQWSDTQNPEISGFYLRMRINTKPNGKQKWNEKIM